MKEATEKQLECIYAIEKFIKEKNYSPSVRELGKILGITFAAAYQRMRLLRKKGLLVWKPGLSRTIQVVE